MIVLSKAINFGEQGRSLVLFQLQWNPSITDTFGDQRFVRYSEVFPAQGLPVYFR